MSFILDALRKSETERQHKGSAEFANVPTSDGRREGPPAWLWVLGALLLVNLAVLIGLFVRPDVGTPESVAGSSAPAVAETSVEEEPREDFASRVEAARENAPAAEEPRPQVTETSPAMTTPIVTPAASAVSLPIATPGASRPIGALPTIHEVRAQGQVSLPDLHVDIHVFSEVASDRFVFINMNKHKEGSQLSEGPLVEEITPDGVVLSMNGTTFLLPRD
jgi:general secretion pathway protein B